MRITKIKISVLKKAISILSKTENGKQVKKIGNEILDLALRLLKIEKKNRK